MVPMIVLATNNQNKVKEFQEILKDFEVEIKSLAEFGPIPEAIEDGETFDDNAYKKAYHTARILGLPAIADDSGIEVDALGGAPGVYSARYAGENASDEDNCQKLLAELKGKTNRKANFSCVISIATPGGPALTYEGKCDGVILEEKRGDSGFGYDPLFYFEEYGKTFAELSSEEKNKVSHRGKALAEVKSEAKQIIGWLKQRLSEEKPPKPDHSEFEDNDWSK
ncbi:MAG: XTP/dITP diphosphatase [Desulfotalea sp.]